MSKSALRITCDIRPSSRYFDIDVRHYIPIPISDRSFSQVLLAKNDDLVPEGSLFELDYFWSSLLFPIRRIDPCGG